MKFTDKLKETTEESCIELTDGELDKVAGGADADRNSSSPVGPDLPELKP